MAVPILSAVKKAIAKDIKSPRPKTGLGKRVQKLTGLVDKVRDIGTSAFGSTAENNLPSLDTDVQATSNVDWDNLPDFNGWSVHQIDSYLFGNQSHTEGGLD